MSWLLLVGVLGQVQTLAADKGPAVKAGSEPFLGLHAP